MPFTAQLHWWVIKSLKRTSAAEYRALQLNSYFISYYWHIFLIYLYFFAGKCRAGSVNFFLGWVETYLPPFMCFNLFSTNWLLEPVEDNRLLLFLFTTSQLHFQLHYSGDSNNYEKCLCRCRETFVSKYSSSIFPIIVSINCSPFFVFLGMLMSRRLCKHPSRTELNLSYRNEVFKLLFYNLVVGTDWRQLFLFSIFIFSYAGLRRAKISKCASAVA